MTDYNDFDDFDDFDDFEEYPKYEDSVNDLYNGKKWYYNEDCFDDTLTDEIQLYNQALAYEDNFSDGEKIKFMLLPLFKDEKDNDTNFTPLLNAGGKVIMNRKELAGTYSEDFHYIIVDYNSIFGLRLLSFQRYNDYFSCDERVLFETFLIKFHSFKFKEFYMSNNTIYKELGIKETRAKSIIQKFIELGLITKTVKQQFIKDFPSKVSYYFVNAENVINFLPKIFDEDHLYEVEKDIQKYLEPAIKRVS